MSKYTKRSDGRYQVKINVNGKTKWLYAKTEKELRQKENELRLKAGKGLDIEAQQDTFGEWGERWLGYKKITVSIKMYNTYKAHFNKYEELFNCPITQLRMSDIQDIIFDLGSGDKPLSAKTLKGVKETACQIIQLAIENRVLDYNCAKSVKIPTSAKPAEKRRALTNEEQRWIRETPHRAQTAAMIMMYAGLRRGELIPLLWSDINLDKATITINKAVEYIDGKPNVKPCGKTDAALRTVYIPRILVDYLRMQEHTALLVCPSAKGKMITEIGWKRLWESYIKELNYQNGDFSGCVGLRVKSKFQPGGLPIVIPPITAHWLRHTFITNMYFAGIDVMTAKEQAGHADIRTTMGIYTHLDGKYKEKQMSQMDKYFEETTRVSNGCQDSEEIS